jgi:hypothetical protein
MDDLNKLYARHGKGEAVSILLVFLLMILGFGTLVYMFLIYEKLNEHITSQGGSYNVPNGLSILLITLCLSWLTLGIINIYYGWKWQNALNIQIRGRTR